MRLSYKKSGVDIEAGYRAVSLIKKHAESTFSPNVLSGLGGFGALYSLKDAAKMKEPTLCAATDGVGTKLKIAFLMDKHDTVGIDCVAMCVNDIVCSGARPLFFLDYIACGKNVPEKIEEIVKGVADGCNLAGCSLIGGETAEMPGFYPEDEYDIAGFCVGLADKNSIISGKNIKEGNTIIGITSSGLHSNGYSLVRSILRPNKEKISEFVRLLNQDMGGALLEPTKIYVKPILKLIEDVTVNGVINITGGGFYENVPRTIPEGLGAKIISGSWDAQPIFKLLKDAGKISEREMYKTFNMGIGMMVVVPSECANDAVKSLSESGEKASVIGTIVKGSGVTICSK